MHRQQTGPPSLLRWETFLALLIALTVLAFTVPSSPWSTPLFFDAGRLLSMAGREVPAGLMALPLTLLVIAGQIDLSVDSILAVASIVFAVRWSSGIGVWPAALVALGAGAAAGMMNALLVVGFRFPSWAVTLCTFLLFRGLAFAILGNGAVDLSGAPAGFTAVGQGNLDNTPIPESLLLFAALAVIFGLALHRWPIGGSVAAIGRGRGPSLSRSHKGSILIGLFVTSGLMSAVAGLVVASQLGSARADIGSGLVLDAVTAVLLGGVSLFGGSGTLAGPALALVLIALLRGGLGLLEVSGDLANLSVGCLLVGAILLRHHRPGRRDPSVVSQ